MDEQRLLDQKQHLTAPGTPDSMSETEIDESKTGIVEENLCITFSLHLNDQLAIQRHLIVCSPDSFSLFLRRQLGVLETTLCF